MEGGGLMKFGLILFILISACGLNEKNFKSHSNIKKHFSLTSTPSYQTVWKRNSIYLNFISSKGWSKDYQALKNSSEPPLFLVHYESYNPIASELQESKSTILIHENLNEGVALIQPQTADELFTYASKLHSHYSFSCGNIEIFDPLSLKLMSNKVLTPAYYAEHIKIDQVQTLLEETSQEKLKSYIKDISSVSSRYHSSTTGLNTPNRIINIIQNNLASFTGFKIDKISMPANSISKQESIIVSLKGESEPEKIIVLGAHLDSINSSDHAAAAPGADDDASGMATLIEIIRIIAKNNLKFERTIEFHFYSAEEIGLIGSSHISKEYAAAGKKVQAMLQTDMNSWSQDPEEQTIHIVSTDTTPRLNQSVKSLLNTYLGGTYKETRLAAGTSDHKAWFNAGYDVVFPFENPDNYNKALHTLNDTTNTINNYKLNERFTKLGLAFVAHQAGLTSVKEKFIATKNDFDRNRLKDIKVAITDSELEELADITIAVPKKIKRVSICKTLKSNPSQCYQDFKTLELIKEGERNFFRNKLNEAFLLTDGDALLLEAYDAEDGLYDQRPIEVQSI